MKMQIVLKDYFSMGRCVQLKYMFEDIFVGTKRFAQHPKVFLFRYLYIFIWKNNKDTTYTYTK